MEGGGDHDPMLLSQGETSKVVDELPFTQELTVSVAVTWAGYVISDIAETNFISSMPAPSFSTQLRIAHGAGGAVEEVSKVSQGRSFYYLGFNTLFDNWYVSTLPSHTGFFETVPKTQKFRVGLRYGTEGLDTDVIDFAHYRIDIRDSNGDLLGYQPATIDAARTYNYDYGTHVIVFDPKEDLLEWQHLEIGEESYLNVSNMQLSNVVRKTSAVSPYYAKQLGTFAAFPEYVSVSQNVTSPKFELSFGNHLDIKGTRGAVVREPWENVVFAEAPAE